MPELPEVETTRLGIMDHLVGQVVDKVSIHQSSLRWPVQSAQLKRSLERQPITAIRRRAKYLLFESPNGTMLCHLGMSGSLRLICDHSPRRKHDHLEWHFANNVILRYHDPRRFGCVLWTQDDVNQHSLIRDLGPEPLTDDFTAEGLYARSRNRKQAVKTFLMDNKNVVGVGNIYASEALFLAGIRPTRGAGRISLARYEQLVEAVKQVLSKAITAGGTTLRDFINSKGEPGYFKQQLNVYDRQNQNCRRCQSPIKKMLIAQRATYFCANCQN